jgi:hypothetical protein
MIVKFWLKINKSGTINVTKSEPGTSQNEIATHFAITVPDALFKKPKLSINADIGKDYKLPDIKAEVVTDIENYVKSVTGLDLHVNVVPVDTE